MKNLKVGVVGLYSNDNVGDYLLVESTKYLVKKHVPDVALKDIDVDPRDEMLFTGSKKVNLLVFELMNRYKPYAFFLLRFKRLRYYYEYFYWWIKVNWIYKKTITDIDCLIIGGGGYLKYKTQGLNYLVELIVKIAKKRGIPVMLSSVGVEGYGEKDPRSQRLKKAINSDIVWTITTRDDIKTLRNKYITNKNTVTDQVGDPVFWLQDVFSTKKRGKGTSIGINLINPNNYKSYGGESDYYRIDNFYKNLIQELSMRDADFYIFTNGMQVDQKFGRRLVSHMRLPKKRLLPRPLDSNELIDMISNFKVIMAGRMHSGIVAYALDVPKVGLIWSEKLEHFANIIGERDTYFDENELDPVKIADLLCNSDDLVVNTKRRDALKKKTLKHIGNFLDSVAKEKGRYV